MLFLVITLFLLLIASCFANSGEIISPSVLFSASFFFSSLCALGNEKRWSLCLNDKTFFVISGGVLEFIIVSFIVRSFFKKTCFNKKSRIITSKYYDLQDNKLLEYKRFSYFLFFIQTIFCFIVARSIEKTTGISNIITAGAYMNATNMPNFVGNKLNLSKLSLVLMNFNYAAGFFFGFEFLKQLILNNKEKIVFFYNMLIGILTPLMVGSRGATVYAVISLYIYYYLLLNEKKNWETPINIKNFFLIMVVAALVIFLLPVTAQLFGRQVGNTTEYLSGYIGAEIKNLDMFITSNVLPIRTGIFGKETFINIMQPISHIFDLNIPQYSLDLPFEYINGYGLGNVFTTFYPWLYDFGYVGVAIMTFIMSFVTEIIYDFARFGNNIYKPALSVLLYGYLASFVSLSFFSNKFFENINTSLVYIIFFWILLTKITLRYNDD